jgi:hypothetical protein
MDDLIGRIHGIHTEGLHERIYGCINIKGASVGIKDIGAYFTIILIKIILLLLRWKLILKLATFCDMGI